MELQLLCKSLYCLWYSSCGWRGTVMSIYKPIKCPTWESGLNLCLDQRFEATLNYRKVRSLPIIPPIFSLFSTHILNPKWGVKIHDKHFREKGNCQISIISYLSRKYVLHKYDPLGGVEINPKPRLWLWLLNKTRDFNYLIVTCFHHVRVIIKVIIQYSMVTTVKNAVLYIWILLRK